MTILKSSPLLLRMALAAMLGLVAALGLAPYEIWPLTLVSLAAVPLLIHHSAGFWRAAWIGWAYGTGYFALALSWIVEPFFVDAARDAWLAPFALISMAGGLSLFWALAFGLAQLFSGRGPTRTVLLILFWTLAEMARGYVLTGFPWAAPAQIWVSTPVLPLLAWTGPQGLTLITLFVALSLSLIAAPGPRRFLGLLPGLALLVATLIVAPPQETKMTGKTVRLVQPNAPQDQKWDPDFMPVFFNRQIEYTAATPRPDLIVWPEASLSSYVYGVEDPLAELEQAAAGVPLAIGLLRPDEVGFYNSLAYFDQAGDIAQVYDKHHLVPFGEYIPFGWLLDGLGIQAIADISAGGMKSGPGPELLDFGSLGKALPLICYEAVFPQDVNRAEGRASFLLQVTNDAWFGSGSGPYQHLAQARMRAAEQGLPMIRVANTGVSAMIDPYGRIIGSLPLGTAGYIDLPLPNPLHPSFYSRTGDLLALFVTLLGIVGVSIRSVFIKALKKD